MLQSQALPTHCTARLPCLDEGLCLQRPMVETSSSQQGISLAQQLKQSGAKMYGAFWCSHCLEQKEEFGQQAMKDFPYVECYPNGFGKVRTVTWRLSAS